MPPRILPKNQVTPLVGALMADYRVVGPVAKGPEFGFEPLHDPAELRLDYNITILPPKTALQPPRERIVRIMLEGEPVVESLMEAAPTVIFGVHTCDLHTLPLLDRAFSADFPDAHYLERRKQALVVSMECLKPCDEHSFCKDMGTMSAHGGYDLHLTDIGDAYVVDVGTDAGAALLGRYADVRSLADGESQRLAEAVAAKWPRFRNRLTFDAADLPAVLAAAYKHPIWKELGDRCLACGSCTNVCPTCYCFNVTDALELNGIEAFRTRAVGLVPVGGVRGSRRRRELPRGAGRTPEASDDAQGQVSARTLRHHRLRRLRPLYSCLRDAHQHRGYVQRDQVWRVNMSVSSIYAPEFARLAAVRPMTELEKLFTVELPGGRSLGHVPGQFVMLSIPGVGEAPISISSSPSRSNGHFELCVRRVGDVTAALHKLGPNSRVGIRGPMGHGFPMDAMRGKDILFAPGGLGLAPLRSLINQVLDERKDFGRVVILYGAKRPTELLFRDELAQWAERKDIEFKVTVDRGDETWKGNVGVITTLFPKVTVNPHTTVAVTCGPPIMYRFVLMEMLGKGIPESQIYLSLERRMKCGVGKCGHCQINDLYCCKEGPVFTYDQIKNVPEAL